MCLRKTVIPNLSQKQILQLHNFDMAMNMPTVALPVLDSCQNPVRFLLKKTKTKIGKNEIMISLTETKTY